MLGYYYHPDLCCCPPDSNKISTDRLPTHHPTPPNKLLCGGGWQGRGGKLAKEYIARGWDEISLSHHPVPARWPLLLQGSVAHTLGKGVEMVLEDNEILFPRRKILSK